MLLALVFIFITLMELWLFVVWSSKARLDQALKMVYFLKVLVLAFYTLYLFGVVTVV